MRERHSSERGRQKRAAERRDVLRRFMESIGDQRRRGVIDDRQYRLLLEFGFSEYVRSEFEEILNVATESLAPRTRRRLSGLESRT